MSRAPIQTLLIEQDYCLRIQHGMTVTDRRKADCWKLGQQYGLHNQTGRATQPKVREALKEVIWTKAANYSDYEPTAGAVDILGQAECNALVEDAREFAAAVARGEVTV